MFTNYKLRRPARLIHLAGTTPQRHVKLAATALWWWSKCLLQIYFFNFFCLSKALQFKNKTQITPDTSLYSMTERHSRFWKEPEQFQLLCCTFCLSNVRCTTVVCWIWQEPHHRVVYRLHRPLMVFPNFTLHETNILVASKAFFKEIRILCFANYLPNAKSVFHFVFASMFVCWMFEVEVEVKYVTMIMSVKSECQFLLLPIYIFTSYEQSSSRHVTLNY